MRSRRAGRVSVRGVPEFSSGRRFQVWKYTVSHSMLLIRSTRDEANSTRIDVLFKPVGRLDLPTSFDGLVIERAAPGRYAVSGPGWSGYVEADTVAVAEDEGEYFDPSPFAEGAGI